MILRKIVIVQCRTGRELTMDENLLIFKQRPDIVVLPEYFNVNPNLRDTVANSRIAVKNLEYCRSLSERLGTILIAGTAIEVDGDQFFNTSFVYNQGEEIGRYRKTNPTDNERKHGISRGSKRDVFKVDGGVRLAILICADVLHPENFIRLKELRPDIIIIPTTSPLKPEESIREKFARDNDIFVSGASAAGSYVVKCCAVGSLWGGNLQGRSLVAAPWGILRRIHPNDESKTRILSAILDISELREFRKKGPISED